MLYVLIGLVVVLALVSGAEYATLRVVRAERKAQVAELKSANKTLTDKYIELQTRMIKLESIKEGIEG